MQGKSSIMPLIAAAIMLLASCGEDSVNSEPPYEEPPVDWPDMTARDDVVETFVLCFENPKIGESISKYNALLHSKYFFGLHADDVPPGGIPIMMRTEDIRATEGIFEFESLLELTITPEVGSWDAYPELEEEPCENCYVTKRQYFIRARFGDEATIYQSPVGKTFMSVIVSPDEADSTKWVLRAMYDTDG